MDVSGAAAERAFAAAALGDGDGDAFAGFPELVDDGTAGAFLVDHVNDDQCVLKPGSRGDSERPLDPEPKTARRDSPSGDLGDDDADDARRIRGRDSAGSAAGRKSRDGESSAGAAGSFGSDASHSLRGDLDPNAGEAFGGGGGGGGSRGGGGGYGGFGFSLSVDEYASLERVAAGGMDDFLGPIMDDGAVDFDDTNWNARVPSSVAVGFAGGGGDAREVSLAQARAQAEARLRAMQHARAQGMGGPPSRGVGGASVSGIPLVGGGHIGNPGGGAMGIVAAGGGLVPATPRPNLAHPSSFGGVAGSGVGSGGATFFPGGPMPTLHLANGTSDFPPSRLERLRRWKEKRKNRNFNKTIRYQSRKVCADNRPRIKGKFVKIGSTPDLGAMDDLGADFERERGGASSGGLGDVPENEASLDEDSLGSGEPPLREGQLARTQGLRRGGGLTASMSVPAGLAMMGGGRGDPSGDPSLSMS